MPHHIHLSGLKRKHMFFSSRCHKEFYIKERWGVNGHGKADGIDPVGSQRRPLIPARESNKHKTFELNLRKLNKKRNPKRMERCSRQSQKPGGMEAL